MKRILVPCDFSNQAKEAFQVALSLAARNKSVIVLLHALPIPTLYTTGVGGETLAFDPVYFTRMEEDTKAHLEKMKSQAAPKDIQVDTEVLYGDLISIVQRVIETKQIDLVVMGTSGSSGLAEIFIGSNTEKIVRYSPVPVLAIRKSLDIKFIKNILLPSTLDLNQTAFINKLKELQHFFDATLHILLINTPPHLRQDVEAKEALEEFAKHYHLKNYKTHFQNYTREDVGIIEFTREDQMDLIAMGTHARKGLAHLFNGSITEDVVNHVKCPIWTYTLKG